MKNMPTKLRPFGSCCLLQQLRPCKQVRTSLTIKEQIMIANMFVHDVPIGQATNMFRSFQFCVPLFEVLFPSPNHSSFSSNSTVMRVAFLAEGVMFGSQGGGLERSWECRWLALFAPNNSSSRGTKNENG